MITQKEADYLIKILKTLKSSKKIIDFPQPAEQVSLIAESVDENKDKFKFYINRKGQYKLTKCTYLLRYKNNQNLLRLDIDGPIHDNPDGTEVKCPHIHIYKEGYGLSWAYPLEDIIQTDPTDLITVLSDFFEYTNIENERDYSIQEGGLI